jgi:hypothetical protein
MLRITAAALAALTLAGCASDAEWARTDPRNAVYIQPGQLMETDTAMADACKRKRAGRSPMTPAWDAYCKGRGI